MSAAFCHPHRSPRTHSGFTLIELLVVISIISLLIGILLPALTAAREAARLTVCANQVKQITLASVMYHNDNNALPSRTWINGPMASLEDRDDFVGAELQPYLNNEKTVFYCPLYERLDRSQVDTEDRFLPHSKPVNTDSGPWHMSYFYLSGEPRPDDSDSEQSQYTEQRGYVVDFDAAGRHKLWQDMLIRNLPGPWGINHLDVNAGYTDGSVLREDFDTLEERDVPFGGILIWW